ncbi:RNA 2'-phosphotransferase [Nocardioides plantarum]|uniref:Probable RNA 2'-phosphotransferase n=1 Tax=Nocardioides plantarum TaxID=29299 RepID=A0ABV5KEX1_9ACTN|nr:RNA 2'-phosphotransferase [Nocardioides plantarum]
MNTKDVSRSKRLSLVLRHQPQSIGITLDANGWVDVATLLDALAAHGPAITRDDLDRVVTANDKQRFEWDVEADRIRARQGHSVEVDLDLEPATPPPLLFHGTPTRNVEAILAEGLHKARRHHVHLSADEDTAHRVGARRGEHVVLSVDAASMADAGHVFWVTGNGVWLADAVPAEYVSRRPTAP